MNIVKLRAFTAEIDGWLSNEEGEFLYKMAKLCSGRGCIVEIGSWKGKSTTWLASGSKAGKKLDVYAVDHHTGSREHRQMYGKVWTYNEFKKNIKRAGLTNIVKPILKTSSDAARNFDKTIEFLFIDGDHDYKACKFDLDTWYPKIVEGGLVAIHDTTYRKWLDGPKLVADRYLFQSSGFKNARFVDTISYAQKTEKPTLVDKIANKYFLFLKNLKTKVIGP